MGTGERNRAEKAANAGQVDSTKYIPLYRELITIATVYVPHTVTSAGKAYSAKDIPL